METVLDSKNENRKRIKSLKRSLLVCSDPKKRRCIRKLIARLEAEIAQGQPYPSLASSNYSRKLRRKERAILKDALGEYEQIKFFHTVLGKWKFPASELPTFSIERFLEMVRYHLRQCDPYDETGFILFRIHGEHEPYKDEIWPHIHGVAAGGMVGVLDKLNKYYKGYDVEDGPMRKVVQKDIGDFDKQLSYIFQSFWPCRYRGPASDNANKTIRCRTKQRMPDDVHTDWMILMDNQGPGSMTIIMGSRSLSSKFKALYRNAHMKGHNNYVTPLVGKKMLKM